MSEIEFSKDEKELLVSKLSTYLDKELSVEIGQFDCEFLVEFISKEIGVYFYNKGLADAQTILQLKMDDLIFAIDDLEKITD